MKLGDLSCKLGWVWSCRKVQFVEISEEKAIPALTNMVLSPTVRIGAEIGYYGVDGRDRMELALNYGSSTLPGDALRYECQPPVLGHTFI